MHKWSITYYGGNNQMKTIDITAPTAMDAMTMFDVNVMHKRENKSSDGPYVGDISSIKYLEKDKQ